MKLLEEKFLNLDKDFNQRPYFTSSQGVEITVWPEFIDSKVSALGDIYIWAYHVRIENRRENSIKLINRYWRIIDENGVVQEVSGEGVVGEQPTIAQGSAHQYSSGVHLRHPSGIMTGHYQMQAADGSLFNAKIPTFSLDVPSAKTVLN